MLRRCVVTGGTLVWFRQDLRLKDNHALHAAVETGQPVIPVYIWSPEEDGEWAPGSQTYAGTGTVRYTW